MKISTFILLSAGTCLTAVAAAGLVKRNTPSSEKSAEMVRQTKLAYHTNRYLQLTQEMSDLKAVRNKYAGWSVYEIFHYAALLQQDIDESLAIMYQFE